jgi:hypothetical protein
MLPNIYTKATTQAVHRIRLAIVVIYRTDRQTLINNLDTSGMIAALSAVSTLTIIRGLWWYTLRSQPAHRHELKTVVVAGISIDMMHLG